jgi:ubiquitin carboxyl-terminal hydrolase 5/13
MDEPDSDEDMEDLSHDVNPYRDDKAGYYSLFAFITHLGTSVHSGHYVCHIKRDGQWIYFNDAKVAATTDPPIGKGYMYFFTKVDKQD